jgi:hypothetical protein
VLEEQLIGVDVAYFSLLITMLRDTEGDFTLHHLSELIDKVFNEYEEPVERITIKQSKMNYYLDRIHRRTTNRRFRNIHKIPSHHRSDIDRNSVPGWQRILRSLKTLILKKRGIEIKQEITEVLITVRSEK